MDTDTEVADLLDVERVAVPETASQKVSLVADMEYSLLAVDLRKLLHISSAESVPQKYEPAVSRCDMIPSVHSTAQRETRSKLRQSSELEDISVHKCSFCSASFNAKDLLARHTLRIHQKAVVSILQEGSTQQHLKCRFCVHKVMHRHQKLLLLHLEKKHALEFVTFLKEGFYTCNRSSQEKNPSCIAVLQKGLQDISLSSRVESTPQLLCDDGNSASCKKLEPMQLFPCPSMDEAAMLWKAPFLPDEKPSSGGEQQQQIFQCSSIILNDCTKSLSFHEKKIESPFAKRKLQMDITPVKPLTKLAIMKENMPPQEALSTVLARSGWKHGPGRQYVCGRCREAFSCNAMLLNHVQSRHKGPLRLLKPLYTCGLCAASFYKNSFLVRHCYQHHTPR